jgi:DNA-binding MarR family transcriptional regulator
VVLVLFDGRAIWLHSFNTEAQVLALYDYVEQMVADGLVERQPNPEDGRSHLLATTAAGKRYVTDVSTAVRAAHGRFADLLDVPLDEAEATVAALRFAFAEALNRDTT